MDFSGFLKIAVFMVTAYLAASSSSGAVESVPDDLNLIDRVVIKSSVKDGVKTIQVTVGPFASREQCREKLDEVLLIETIKFTQAMFQDNYARPSELPDIQYLRDNLVSVPLFEQFDLTVTLQVELTFS